MMTIIIFLLLSGGTGGWRKYLDDKMVEKMEKWMTEKGKGLEKEFKWMP